MRNLSFFEALLHMFKGSIGPGVLSLPYALSQSGICFLPVVLCLQAACAYCMLLMVKMKQDLEKLDNELVLGKKKRAWASKDIRLARPTRRETRDRET